jgi:hypothetical protein
VVFFLGAGVVESAFTKTGDLKGDLSNTSWIEGVKALEDIKEMPYGGGAFFLEELGNPI